ncbi:unnamed protein product [Cyprideis torosa]|uniref:UDP-glucose 6-dehydrogenase n=1 Tax=Cyprideis torosa TaxID=163714 RepID=A0A7R8ZWI9_9CRUS|nr:unnamed protein product [Cyprideis torosa]CAG0905341.1 unnamed protein product [Cyprideis torosa]
MKQKQTHIAIIGLGYVGLPLAVAFAKVHPTLGFDPNTKRIQELRRGKDTTLEVEDSELEEVANKLNFTDEACDIAECTVYIIAVPTPIDPARQPDLRYLQSASEIVGKNLRPGDHVIYESTVYPGCTEEVCVPILEQCSGLRLNHDFFCGYSPERINPGDKEHRLADIIKITSGSSPEAAQYIDALYRDIITAGTFQASSIKVAEAAKVIENTQRDVNIALINELALIFHKLHINTTEVLQAAGTKWNFLPFSPGLVGGHCIGVDPYYLTYKAQKIGYHPSMILAGRRLNDSMGQYVAGALIKLMVKRKIDVTRAKVLILGLTFKENCPDLRNTKVIDSIGELEEYNIEVDVYDPWANPDEAQAEYGVALLKEPLAGEYDGILITVAHDDFKNLGPEHIRSYGKKNHVLYDVKNLFPPHLSDASL